MNKAIENNNRRPGYKKTKLGWIPEEWQIQKLKHVAKFSNGKAHEMHIQESGSFILINSKFISTDGAVKKYTEENLKPLCKGDIVMVMSDVPNGKAIAKCYLIEENNKYTLNQRICSLTAKDVDNVFLFYQLNRNTYYLRFDDGVGQTNLRKNQVLDCPLRIPPLPEQKKIAEILSTWDRAIETLEQLIAKKEELKRGLMQELLTPNNLHRWNEVKLGKLGEFSKGKGVSKTELIETGIPAVRYGELYTAHHVIVKKFTSYINRESADQSKRIHKGDILFAGSGETAEEIGKCAVFNDAFEAYAGGDIVILSPKNVDSVYLSYYLNSAAAIKQKSRLGQGHSVVHIYSRNLKQIKVLLPDVERQKRIVQIFTTLENEIELLKDQKVIIEVQKKGLMQQLLTGKTRVKEEN